MLNNLLKYILVFLTPSFTVLFGCTDSYAIEIAKPDYTLAQAAELINKNGTHFYYKIPEYLPEIFSHQLTNNAKAHSNSSSHVSDSGFSMLDFSASDIMASFSLDDTLEAAAEDNSYKNSGYSYPGINPDEYKKDADKNSKDLIDSSELSANLGTFSSLDS